MKAPTEQAPVCVFVGMGRIGASIVSNLFYRVKRSPVRIDQQRFFIIFDSDPRPEYLPKEVLFCHLTTDVRNDVPLLKQRVIGFEEFFPKEAFVPYQDPWSSATLDHNGVFMALCNSLLDRDRGLTSVVNAICKQIHPHTEDRQPILMLSYFGDPSEETTAGLALHLPYLMGNLFERSNHRMHPWNIAVFMKPETRHRYCRALTYATILTLDNWQQQARCEFPEWRYKLQFADLHGLSPMEVNFQPEDRPYDMIYWVGDRISQTGMELQLPERINTISEFMYDLLQSWVIEDRILSSMACIHGHQARDEAYSLETGARRPLSYGSFGLSSLIFPRENILKYCGDVVAARWRQLFVDVHYDCINADIREIVSTIAEKHNLAESAIFEIWRARFGALLVGLSRPNDKRCDMLRSGSSNELANHILRCVGDLQGSYQEAMAEMKLERRAEATADDLVAKLAEDLLGCLKGQEEQYRKVIAGRQISFYYASAKAFDDYLGSLVGDNHVGVMTGLHVRAEELHTQLEKELCTLTEIRSANKRKGLFHNPVKDDAEEAWAALERIAMLYKDLYIVYGAIKMLTIVRSRLRVVLTDSISVFKDLMDRHFVAKHENVENMPLPPLQAEEEERHVNVIPVLWNREFIQQLWLTDWISPLESYLKDEPDRTVQEMFLSLGHKLVSFGGSKGAGPLNEAMESIMKKAVSRDFLTPEELAQDAVEKFKNARSILDDEVARSVQIADVWSALWKECELKARDGGEEHIARAVFSEMLNRSSPLWELLDVSDLEGVRPEINTFVFTNEHGLTSMQYSKHPLYGIAMSALNSDRIRLCGPRSWEWGHEMHDDMADCVHVVQVAHGYPVSRLFEFERNYRDCYDREEASLPESKGIQYLHTDYRYRHFYRPLDFEKRVGE